MGQYVLRRRIAASPDRVFRAFIEPDLLVDWMDAQALQDASGPLDGTGSTYRLVIFRFHSFHTTVVRSVPPHVHETRGHGRFGWFRMVATLTPVDGGTDLELLTEYGLPLGPVGRWLDRRWIDREPRTQANKELDRLVAIVTATDAVAPGASTAVATGDA
jgi:hypothetical protein